MVLADRQGNLSIRGAAVLVGVSPHTLRSWLRQRRLAHIRLGRRVVIDPKDLDAFIKKNRIEAR